MSPSTHPSLHTSTITFFVCLISFFVLRTPKVYTSKVLANFKYTVQHVNYSNMAIASSPGLTHLARMKLHRACLLVIPPAHPTQTVSSLPYTARLVLTAPTAIPTLSPIDWTPDPTPPWEFLPQLLPETSLMPQHLCPRYSLPPLLPLTFCTRSSFKLFLLGCECVHKHI